MQKMFDFLFNNIFIFNINNELFVLKSSNNEICLNKLKDFNIIKLKIFKIKQRIFPKFFVHDDKICFYNWVEKAFYSICTSTLTFSKNILSECPLTFNNYFLVEKKSKTILCILNIDYEIWDKYESSIEMSKISDVIVIKNKIMVYCGDTKFYCIQIIEKGNTKCVKIDFELQHCNLISLSYFENHIIYKNIEDNELYMLYIPNFAEQNTEKAILTLLKIKYNNCTIYKNKLYCYDCKNRNFKIDVFNYKI